MSNRALETDENAPKIQQEFQVKKERNEFDKNINGFVIGGFMPGLLAIHNQRMQQCLNLVGCFGVCVWRRDKGIQKYISAHGSILIIKTTHHQFVIDRCTHRLVIEKRHRHVDQKLRGLHHHVSVVLEAIDVLYVERETECNKKQIINHSKVDNSTFQ